MDKELDEKLALLCRLSGAETLQEIADAAFEVFGNPIFISDMAQTILAYTKAFQIEDKYWQERIVQGKMAPRSAKQHNEVRAIYKEAEKNRLPLFVRDQEVPHPRLVKMLCLSGNAVGVVVLPGIFKPPTQTDVHLLELLSVFINRRIERERFLLSPNEKSVENFIIKLLDGDILPPEQIQTRMDILNWRPLPYLYVLAISPDESGDRFEPPDNILSHLSAIPFCRSFMYENTLVFILSRKTPVSNWPKDEPELYEAFARWTVLVGVSRAFQDIASVREHYHEAATALRLGRTLDTRQNLCPYNFYFVYHLLEALPPEVNLRNYYHEKILKLEKQDKSADKELLTTLQVYLELSQNTSKTAELLSIHRNTVRYRISKCMEIMQTDLANSEDIFSFILSLRIIEFEKKIIENHSQPGFVRRQGYKPGS